MMCGRYTHCGERWVRFLGASVFRTPSGIVCGITHGMCSFFSFLQVFIVESAGDVTPLCVCVCVCVETHRDREFKYLYKRVSKSSETGPID